MGWHRWSVRAPNRHHFALDTTHNNDTLSDCTPRSLSLYDTSPSLVGTQPASDTAMDVFVPESQYPNNSTLVDKSVEERGGVSTPKTDITMDFIVQTSLRQRKVRTVDRVVGRGERARGSTVTSDLISALASPIKNHGLLGDSLLCPFDEDLPDGNTSYKRRSKSHAMSPKKLFTTSPNLLTSTPIIASKPKTENIPLNHINDIVNYELTRSTFAAADCTQILFDTPQDPTQPAIATVEHYSGHSPVFLPASFEALNIGCVISEPDIPSPIHPIADPHKTTVRTIAVETSQTTAKKRSRFRSSPPSEPCSLYGEKRRRVSFAAGTGLPFTSTLGHPGAIGTPSKASTPSTGSVLSSIDNGRLEKKYLDKCGLKVVQTPIVKYEIPGSTLKSVGESGVVKPVKSRKPAKTPLGVPKSNIRNDKPAKTPPKSIIKNDNPNVAKVAKTPKTPTCTTKIIKSPPTHQPADCVWARWKPDKAHFLVPADLLEQSGSTTRSVWRARLHHLNTTVTLTSGDFVKLTPKQMVGMRCRLTKKPTVEVTVVSWESSRVVGVRREDSGEMMTVPSRHLYLDSTDLLTGTATLGAQQQPESQLFQHMRFLISSNGTTTSEKTAIQDTINQHGGTVITRIDDRTCTTNVTLITSHPPKRTFKYLMAVILDIPRVNVQWLLDCTQKGVKWPTRSPAYSVDCIPTAGKGCPLVGLVWSVNRDKETRSFHAEFTVILRALGATVVVEGGECEFWLVSSGKGRRHTRGRVVVAEQLVDCIVNNDFTIFTR